MSENKMQRRLKLFPNRTILHWPRRTRAILFPYTALSMEKARIEFVLKAQDNTRMAHPIDPSQIGPEDIGEERATLEMSHEE
jgi:hypothetical protein